jgi:hypothetical protein
MDTSPRLPPFILADWYKNDLVITGDATISVQKSIPPVKKRQPVVIKKLGDHLQKVTILVNTSEAAFLPEEEFTLLSNILKACNLTMADVAVVNWNRTPAMFSEIKQQLGPKYLLLFRVSTAEIDLPFSIPLYQIQEYDQCKLIQSASLEQMLGDNDSSKLEKSKLWSALRKMLSSFITN